MIYAPFNLDAAIAGEPVVLSDGHPVRILCYDLQNTVCKQGYIVGAVKNFSDNREFIKLFDEAGAPVEIGSGAHDRDDPRTLCIAINEKDQVYFGLYIDRHGRPKLTEACHDLESVSLSLDVGSTLVRTFSSSLIV